MRNDFSKNIFSNIIHNFWLRNIILFFIILLLIRLVRDDGSIRQWNAERLMPYYTFAIDYTWIFFFNSVLLQKFLLKGKLKGFFLLFIISYLAYIPFYFAFFNIVEPPYMFTDFIVTFFVLLIHYLTGMGVFFMFRYALDRERFYKAAITSKEVEMEHLKGQLNPHFLFNALNSIYSYLLIDSKNGQELILKLSELMRYILDNSKKETVDLHSEIEFIETFVAFELERHGSRCEVVYKKDIKDEGWMIPPLILFSFIENAFKHGIDSINRSVVDIAISAGEKELILSVENNILLKESPKGTSTGLVNTKRRLELLYPGTHTLKIINDEFRFFVELKIQG